MNLTISRSPFQASCESRVHSFRTVPVVTSGMGKSHSFFRHYQKTFPRVYWFARHGKQPTPGKTLAKATLVSGDTVYDDLQTKAGLGSFSLGVQPDKVVVRVCVHTRVAWRKGMEAIKPRDGSGQSSRGPSLPGLGAPPAQGCRPLWSAHQVSTSVLPAPGGKQPAIVVLLWIQQAAFISPNSETLHKSNRGQVTASWEGSHKSLAQSWEEATVLTHRDLCLCVLCWRCRHTPEYKSYAHKRTHTCPQTHQ